MYFEDAFGQWIFCVRHGIVDGSMWITLGRSRACTLCVTLKKRNFQPETHTILFTYPMSIERDIANRNRSCLTLTNTYKNSIKRATEKNYLSIQFQVDTRGMGMRRSLSISNISLCRRSRKQLSN